MLVLTRVQEVPDTVDLEEGLSEQAASALRILYAATQPLEEDPKSLRYEQFLMELGPIVRHQLTISIVIDFLRMALEVPAEEYLVLVPLISEAQHARGTFGNQKSDRVMCSPPPPLSQCQPKLYTVSCFVNTINQHDAAHASRVMHECSSQVAKACALLSMTPRAWSWL